MKREATSPDSLGLFVLVGTQPEARLTASTDYDCRNTTVIDPGNASYNSGSARASTHNDDQTNEAFYAV